MESEDYLEEDSEMLELVNDIDKHWDAYLDENVSKTEIKMNVKRVIAPMKIDVREDRDSVTVISSHKRNGLGKSALSYWMARFNEPKHFQIDRNFFFKGAKKEIIAKGNTLPNFSMIVMDEVLRLLYKRKAITSEVIDFNIWLGADQRKTNQILVGNIPDFFDIDKYAREGKVSTWIEVLDRGIGVVFEADSFVKVDPWHENEFDEIIRDRKRGIKESPLDQLRLLKRHWCYRGPIFWSDFPPEDKTEYLRLVKHYSGVSPSEAKEMEEEEQELAKARAGMACVRAIDMMTRRGIQRHIILREINYFSENDYKKYSNMLSKQKEIEDKKKMIEYEKLAKKDS